MRHRMLGMILPLLLGQTRPAHMHADLQNQLEQINAKTASVQSLTADFFQRKYTAMLTEPLVSHGKLVARGPVMLWTTTDPERTLMRVDAKEIKIYYPTEKTLEVYAIEEKLGMLAASPLPRLAVLERYFTIQKLPTAANHSDEIALQLMPIGDLSQHVHTVKVLLQINTGLLLQMELIDTDNDDTVIDFSHVEIDAKVSERDVDLTIPKDVKITHPLAGLESQGP